MFLESPTFPGCPNFGYQAQPRYSVTLTQTASGRERRNRNWLKPLLVFDCVVGPRDEDTIQELLEWWHAVGSSECGFRFIDSSDFKSCRTSETPTRLDMPVQTIVGSPTTYQLVKTYTKGTRQQVRPIVKPVQGTILVALAGVLKTEGSDYTLDYTTGIITPTGSWGSNISWGGEFDVPVRFASEFPIQIVDKEIQSVTFTLQEVRDFEFDSSDSPA